MTKFDSLFKEVVGEGYLPVKVKGQKLYGLGPLDYGHGDDPNEARKFWTGTSAKQILRQTEESSVVDAADYSLERTHEGVQVWGADEFVVYIGPDPEKVLEVAVKDFQHGGDFTQSED